MISVPEDVDTPPRGRGRRILRKQAVFLQALLLSRLDSRSPEDRESWGPVPQPCQGGHVRVC